jgi:Fur family transcriptional regulator, iron response regulator
MKFAVAESLKSANWVSEHLRHAGLRPTRQRVDLGRVLFSKGNRHVSVEELHAEAETAGFRVSRATVYNALHRFTASGLVLEVILDNGRTYFDTNLTDHHHFFVEGEGRLIDVVADIGIDRLPRPPEGMEITSVELIMRVRRRL